MALPIYVQDAVKALEYATLSLNAMETSSTAHLESKETRVRHALSKIREAEASLESFLKAQA